MIEGSQRFASVWRWSPCRKKTTRCQYTLPTQDLASPTTTARRFLCQPSPSWCFYAQSWQHWNGVHEGAVVLRWTDTEKFLLCAPTTASTRSDSVISHVLPCSESGAGIGIHSTWSLRVQVLQVHHAWTPCGYQPFLSSLHAIEQQASINYERSFTLVL